MELNRTTSNFYPRSPCGERPSRIAAEYGTPLFLSTLSLRRATGGAGNNAIRKRHFYPRSPCGERRVVSSAGTIGKSFLSTLSLRRATELNSSWISSIKNFYPRSPCGERLARHSGPLHGIYHFYPRSPCGERPCLLIYGCWTALFLSTLSLRRATEAVTTLGAGSVISIHALLAESDNTIFSRIHQGQHFYPRSPCGERL